MPRLLFIAILLFATNSPAQSILTLHPDRPGIAVSPTLYGIFFEDISRSADGGLYAELIQNRSFEDDPAAPAAWDITPPTAATIDTAIPLNPDNPHYLTLNAPATLTNTGFHGIPARQGAAYHLSLRARASQPTQLTASLVSATGQPLATTTLTANGDWKELTTTLTPTATDPHAKLLLTTPGPCSLDMISLMPTDTWKSQPLRPDLATFLDDLHPAFVRFPGGCWVEGDTMATAYRWKKTIGPIDHRATVYNLWKYHATNGLGFHEYLQLCEDLGAAPLYVTNVGMSHHQTVPLDQMHEWVQDALDALEYANGPADSKWGSIRAQNGHPAPFNLKFMEIGNENGGPDYDARYALFYDAIKASPYKDVRLIADLWHGTPRSRPIELLDEHYYADPSFFIRNAERYDSYDRSKYKVYVGEYAVTQGCGKGNLRAAVAEAAFMTGLERNADVVQLASYAPLFAHTQYTSWSPNAINFDNARSYGTPSYYVQQLFSRNRADTIVPLDLITPQTHESHPGQVGVGTWRTQAEFKDIRIGQGGRVLSPSSGTWNTQGEILQQSSNLEGAFALSSASEPSDFTLSLKARKLSGSEGFLIRFHSTSDKDYTMWNLGGWRNTKSAVELSRAGTKSQLTPDAPLTIDPNRWYDIRIQAKADHVQCFLDDKLVQEFTYPSFKSLYAVAGRAGADTILKVANVSPTPQPTTIHFGTAGPTATLTTLTSPSPDDENSLDAPNKVVPKTSKIDLDHATLPYTFPPNSVTVIRVPTNP